MTGEEQAELIKAVATFVKERTEPLRDHIAELERQNALLRAQITQVRNEQQEAKHELRDWMERNVHRGEWGEGVEYQRDNRVSLGGSEWICNAETTVSRPTTHSRDWIITAKRGRDAPRAPSHRHNHV